MEASSKTQMATVGPNLFNVHPEGVNLLAGRDRKTGRLVFPLPEGDWQSLFESVELPREGKLWTYTIQRFCPKPPYDADAKGEEFEPYAVGFVEFEGQIIVEGILHCSNFETLNIGMQMATVSHPYRTQEDGSKVLTYAFEPVEKVS